MCPLPHCLCFSYFLLCLCTVMFTKYLGITRLLNEGISRRNNKDRNEWTNVFCPWRRVKEGRSQHYLVSPHSLYIWYMNMCSYMCCSCMVRSMYRWDRNPSISPLWFWHFTKNTSLRDGCYIKSFFSVNGSLFPYLWNRGDESRSGMCLSSLIQVEFTPKAIGIS